MAKRKRSIQKFMKHSGSVDGPPDLSSRRGFSSGVGKIKEKVEKSTTVESTRSTARQKTRQAASLQ
jgi:hypothetical protein